MKPGVEVLDDVPGLGPLVEKKVFYDFRLRMWLSRGDPIRWSQPWGLYDRGRLEDDGTTLFTSPRVDREYMFAGLFYGVEGMRGEELADFEWPHISGTARSAFPVSFLRMRS